MLNITGDVTKIPKQFKVRRLWSLMRIAFALLLELTLVEGMIYPLNANKTKD